MNSGIEKVLKKISGHIFIIPLLVVMAVLTVYPIVYAFYASVHSGTPLNLSFVAFDNYKEILFSDTRFWNSVKITFFFTLICVSAELGSGMALAGLGSGAGFGLVPVRFVKKFNRF